MAVRSFYYYVPGVADARFFVSSSAYFIRKSDDCKKWKH